MTIQNNDWLLVNRGSDSNKIRYQKIKDDILAEVPTPPPSGIGEAPNDGKQYGRQSETWTEITAQSSEYGDDDVDAHLNKSGQTIAGQILSWDGSDYKWVNDETGSGGSFNPNTSNYTYPGGQERTIQNRLQDYVSVKDFGAVGDGSTDDTAAITAAIGSSATNIYFPKGEYRVTTGITCINTSKRFFGDGASASIFLYDPPDEVKSAFTLKYNFGGDNGQGYSFADIGILCVENKKAGAAVALWFDDGNGLNGSGQMNVIGQFEKLRFNNVNIGSKFTSDSNTGYFRIGLYLLNSSGVVGDNLSIFTNAKDKVEYGDVESMGIFIHNTRELHAMIRTLSLTKVYIQRYHTAIRVVKEKGAPSNIESIYVHQGEILAAKGLDLQAGHANVFSNLHMDVRDHAAKLGQGAATTRFVGCDIRAGRDGSEDVPVDGPDGDWLMQLRGNNTIVSACNLISNRPRRGAIVTAGEGTNADNFNISGNWIVGNQQSNYLALKVDNGSINVVFGGNTFSEFGGTKRPIEDDTNGQQLFIFGTPS